MSQQPDLTIPFDASVVDEEALRALRAVQRMLPTGDGGASGNLVGGTEAVCSLGTAARRSVRARCLSGRTRLRWKTRIVSYRGMEASPSASDLTPSNDNPGAYRCGAARRCEGDGTCIIPVVACTEGCHFLGLVELYA